MHGSQSIENVADRWNNLAQTICLRALLFNIGVGMIVGVFTAHVRLHLGLSGHKIVLWLVPVLAARFIWRAPLGATMGTTGAMLASFAMGGNLAGGIPYMALLVLAGGVMDALVTFAQNRGLHPVMTIALLSGGGMCANLLCVIKRLLTPVYNHSVILGLSGPIATIISYAIFGLLAGLIGATVGLGAVKLAGKQSDKKNKTPNTCV
ncbi:MAG: hypothetical protein HN350_01630 [Phycisphaerales bacterium]|jgi:hypothetical protein|nr:hypothetical protein [Phycisphaerales bacterium]